MRYAKFFILAWTIKTFSLSSSVAEFLNTLPPQRQMEAKVTCWDYACVVYYRVDK